MNVVRCVDTFDNRHGVERSFRGSTMKADVGAHHREARLCTICGVHKQKCPALERDDTDPYMPVRCYPDIHPQAGHVLVRLGAEAVRPDSLGRLAFARSGVEGVPESIADQVDCQDGRKQERSRKH